MKDLARTDVTPLWKDAQLARGGHRYKRKVAGAKRREQIIDAKMGSCRVCGGSPVTFHHVVPRSLGGADTEANWVPLCGSGTTGCHGKVEARDPEACRLLAERLTDAEYSYAVERGGEGFLERRYGIVYSRAGAGDAA